MLYRETEVLILDEPTAVLIPQEVDELIQRLRDLKKMGKTIILITHKLNEVKMCAEDVYKRQGFISPTRQMRQGRSTVWGCSGFLWEKIR